MNSVVERAFAQMRVRLAQAGFVPAYWHEGAPALVADVLASWQCEPLDVMTAGAGVLPPILVATPAGSAVLKLAPEVAHQANIMREADGAGYARVYESDPRGAALFERLGSDAAEFGDAARQASLMAEHLALAWRVPLGCGQRLDEPKATQLLGLLRTLGPQFGADARLAIAHATWHAEQLATEPREEVVCHGDPHSLNLLRRPTGGWAFVDPDGFLGERSYDLGVTMRDFRREISSAESCEPGASVAFMRRTSGRLAAASGEDEARIWSWSCVERVTTGLYLRRLGYEDEGQSWLRAAQSVAAADDRWDRAR